jgi:hypothetical protein
MPSQNNPGRQHFSFVGLLITDHGMIFFVPLTHFLTMNSQPDADLARSLNDRKGGAFCINQMQYSSSKPNQCHTNALVSTTEHLSDPFLSFALNYPTIAITHFGSLLR